VGNKIKKKLSVSELVGSLKEPYRVLGSMDRYVSTVSPIEQAGGNSLAFCSEKKQKPLQLIGSSKAGVIVCPDGIECSVSDYQDKTLIQVSNPRLTFLRLLQRHFVSAPEFGIHPSAVIDRKARIDPQVYIGPNCYIGACQIDEGTVLYGNAYVYPKTKIGKRVIIHAGTVIGADGFGYERNESGELERFPQLGGVIIGADVDIGSNVSIDRGALGDTIIDKGTKINNLVHIAHNVRIGKHCVIASFASLSGTVRVGDYSWIAPHVCIREGISIGSHVLVGMGSVVTKDVGDNLVVIGAPAREVRKNT
jgi:UDP-3-O-[3-hydroxymyristoyl] glucosamine N-acyltransferase